MATNPYVRVLSSFGYPALTGLLRTPSSGSNLRAQLVSQIFGFLEDSLRPTAYAAITLSLLAGLNACRTNPIRQGCRNANGLDKSCGVSQGGRWFKPADGMIAEELRQDALKGTFRVQLRSLDSLRAFPTTSSITRSATVDVDAVDDFLIDRYLYHASYSGALETCLRTDATKLAEARKLIRQRDTNGYYTFLQLGPVSSLSSRQLSAALASLDVKATLESDFSRVLNNTQQAKAAADVAYRTMRRSTEQDFAAGMYRYIMMKNPGAAWTALLEIDAVRPECKDRSRSIGQGMVVALLTDRKQFVEQTTGTDLAAKFVSELGVSNEVAKQLDLAAKATVEAQVKREATRTLRTELESPAVIPLRWKADRFQ